MANGMKKKSTSLVVRARQGIEAKKNHAVQLKKTRKGFFGKPRDLSTNNRFGRRDAEALHSHKRWFVAILVFVRAGVRALGL
jgi:hypothetical protein